MKKLIFILVTALVLIGAWIVYNAYILFFVPQKTQPTPSQKSGSSTDAPAVKPSKTLTVEGNSYAYDYFNVTQVNALSLLPNFTQKTDVQSLMADKGCVSAINGGFYDKNDKPLGLFQSGSTKLGGQIDSALVNGFVWGDSVGLGITSNLPDGPLSFALQTGPSLMFSGQVQTLAIRNDTGARRMIAATTKSGFTFLTVYKADSVYEGPLLGVLPLIVQAISDKDSLEIIDAINLDGGTASAFYSTNTKLSELVPVGSLFCLKS